MQRWTAAKIVELFGADLRSLAVFRVVLALLVLADLANRATDLYPHYSDLGVLPRTALVEQVLSPWAFSLNLMNGMPFFQALLFGVAALAALGLLVGYRTRLMTIVVWVLLLSLHMRNPLVNGAESPMLRMLLFWGMLLPLGAYWSVDRAKKAAVARVSPRFLSQATVGLFLQIAFVYWFTAALKSGPEWRADGTALYYALSLEQISTQTGQYLLNFPDLLHVMTFATFGLEAIGPFLLFCPFFTGPVRTAGVLAFVGLHFGIWLTMDIGIFPWISAFCMVCFLPGWFWDRALALRSVSLRRIGPARRLQLATAARLVRTTGASARARLSSVTGAGQLLFAGPTLRAGNGVPHATAAGTTGRDETAVGHETRHHAPGEEPEPVRLRSSLATNLLALVFLLYVLCWNLTTVSAFTLPERAAPLGPFLGLDQSWGMFAPSPSSEDGWFVMPGNLRDGQRVDLMPVTRDDYRPHGVSW